jgi:hypothetical protein
VKHAKVFVKVPSSARLSTSTSATTPPAGSPTDPPRPFPPPVLAAAPVEPPHPPPLIAKAPHDAGERQLSGIFEALVCPVRLQILLQLCVAPAGRAHVQGLCRLTGTRRAIIGRHLRDLKLRGYIFPSTEARHTWYQCDPRLVRLTRRKRGDILTVRLPSGPWLRLGLPAALPALSAPASSMTDSPASPNARSSGA